jgi:fructose-bisphosphate aldolase, class II
MPLVSIVEPIRKAQAGKYCLPMFLVADLASAEGTFKALEEKRSPAMIGIYSGWLDNPNHKALVEIVRTLGTQATVPVSLVLDHGRTLEHCWKALALGFTDIMYDGSKLPFDENIANVKLAVRAARTVGAGVEAELGLVGDGSAYDTVGSTGMGFTDPAAAERFCEETGCDILAVAIGNAHGFYKGEPKLDIPRLREIRKRTKACLSLHGGTGLSDDQFRAAIAEGITKVNIFTDLAHTAGLKIQELAKAGKNGYFDALAGIREGFREKCSRYCDVFGSTGKA